MLLQKSRCVCVGFDHVSDSLHTHTPSQYSAVVVEGNWNTILIANDLATHVTVLDISHTKTVANTSTASSIAQSFRR